ncbi:MAG: hypothetical protein QM739_19025 [Propionivibrio sp.]
MLRLTFAAAFTLSACLAHAIPKAAEDENGTVSIVPDVPRPKASAKTAKPAAKQSAAPAKKTTKSAKQMNRVKSPSAQKVAKTKTKKPVLSKK